MNKIQKILFAILLPISLFFLTYSIAYYISGEYNPFDEDFGQTAYLWFIYVLIVLCVELLVFKKRK
ncbi:hypothetical protein D4R71_07485 [bacterium]|nr:MAG: hypothetical protein D4R71_07485 [bacterium]